MNVRRTIRSAAAIGAAGALALGVLTACSSDDSNDAGPTTDLPTSPAAGEPIKIGFIGAEGGVVALPQLRAAAEATAKYLNDNAGGINGHKVDLVVCNQQEDPASATKCANEMVEKKVAVVAVPMTSQGAVMLPIIARSGIPYVAQAPVSAVEMGAPGGFMISGGSVAVLKAQAQTAAKEGVKKFTMLIGDSGDAAASIGQMAQLFFKPAGIEVKTVIIPSNVADPTPQITAGLADKPDAVTILGDTRQCIAGLKALKSAAPTVKKYLIATCLDKKVTEAVGEDAVEGAKAFTTVVTTGDDPSVVQYRSVLAKYAPDVDPHGVGYLGYQVISSIAEVGHSLPAGPVTAAQFKAAFAAAKDLPVPAAPGLTFTCNGKAFPKAPNLCGTSMLVSTVGPDGVLEDSTVVN
ncbi:ABC transporter substrate-binding protein [Gordonia crocea]|uniref:ABC transporter substrate-binding protein n=1 Tax=Gordonia crocea TaxID=589162 RepID=A0A7M3SUK9_9ACTN|nr:ABC transporter substrate-binding protein [Gordonia crocea]GED96333.1 ABC transporter substrate-binding protein [Gordonia crocea]